RSRGRSGGRRARARPDSRAAPRAWTGRPDPARGRPGYRGGGCRTRVSSVGPGRLSRRTDRHGLAEVPDERLDALADVVEVVRGGRAGERAPDGTPRPVQADAHRAQDRP